MIRHDRDQAHRAWIVETAGADRANREQSDFLRYRDSKTWVADFHGLRHHFVDELINASVQPGATKELGGHSTITLTMDRYAHNALKSIAPDIAKLAVVRDASVICYRILIHDVP